MSYQYKLYGAILGDLAGQPYEYKYKGDFSEFQLHDPKSTITDDTIMTIATAATLIGDFASFEAAYKAMFKKYPANFYGNQFREWCASPKGTIGNSYGNGCLMRISPCMWINNIPESLSLSIDSCMTSHSHPDSIKAILKLNHLYCHEARYRRTCYPFRDRKTIHEFEMATDAKTTIEYVNDFYLSCDKYISDEIKRVVKMGGDTDTNASIIGELLNYTFKTITQKDIEYVESKLDGFLLDILKRFNEKF